MIAQPISQTLLPIFRGSEDRLTLNIININQEEWGPRIGTCHSAQLSQPNISIVGPGQFPEVLIKVGGERSYQKLL